MSKLPQTDELAHAGEGFDSARVEEAFATFADRVRELEAVASELRAELRSLRAERAAPGRFEDEDWPVDAVPAGGGLPAADWVAKLPPPLAHGLTVPRLALEAGFLLVVALLAGLADLGAGWIVLVMSAAWGLVALAEWAAFAKRSRWRLDEIAPPVVSPGPAAADTTGPWDLPVVEATAIASQPASSESKTVVTKLPAEPEDPEPPQAAQPAAEPERAKVRRLGLRRRKQPVEDAAADPWEA